jgi:hypothetical protein
MSDDAVITLKILVVGDSGTGKSSLLMRFIDDVFDPDQGPTIGTPQPFLGGEELCRVVSCRVFFLLFLFTFVNIFNIAT